MLEAFVSGFWQTMAWPAFGYMLLGIAIGFWVGLLPGIGGLSTLALMLPFSYSIKDPISAFAFLLGMLAVTGTTGDLNVDSVRDPRGGILSRLNTRRLSDVEKRRSRPRLGRRDYEFVSFGSVIGALSLALSIPIVRPLVLLFGSPELFIIAIMGITFIGTLAGPSLIKGITRGRYWIDARSDRRRSANRVLALYIREPLPVGSSGSHTGRRRHVRDTGNRRSSRQRHQHRQR